MIRPACPGAHNSVPKDFGHITWRAGGPRSVRCVLAVLQAIERTKRTH
ncbi:hypothetical protein [Polaromonas sp. CG9_12]|nr:hypothetical protein [Polaromonas sp. CG9_12]